MQFTVAIVALAAATVVSAQGVTSVITPTASAPAGCSTNYAGTFEITVVKPSKKREIVERQSTTCNADGTLVAQLKSGVLTDSQGRIGAIVANGQFQFDGPPAQAGSIYTGGWSVCGNGSLALGGSSVFYQCLSGTFYNLYDRSTGAQCEPVIIDVIPCGTGSGASAVSQTTDGQPQAASATKVTQISDGQVQASSAVPKPVSQYTDGQLQVTAKPATVTPVTQISDGQIQASSARPVTTKPAPVSQISDGQIQATSAATAKPAPVSQISDGQIQATSAATLKTTTTARAPVSQISDGQIQATAASNATTPAKTTTPAAFTGAASAKAIGAQFVAGAVVVVAAALL